MTRLFLAAGVAALALASAASAKPGGGNGGGGPHGGGNPHGGGQQLAGGGGGRGNGGGGGGGPAFMDHGSGGRQHGGGGPMFMGGGGGGHGHGGFAAMQMQRPQEGGRQMHVQRQQFARQQQVRGDHGRGQQFARQQGGPQHMRGNDRQQARMARQEQQRGFDRQHMRGPERQQAQNGLSRQGQQFQQGRDFRQRPVAGDNALEVQRSAAFRDARTSFADNRSHGLIDGCPPGLWMKGNGCMPPGQAAKLVGSSLAAASSIVPLSVLPESLSYLYPDTSDYYWRYGDGYAYQVDRGTQLIAALLPLIGGGYVPGQYLPQPYMASYVPDYYGLNSFYPDYGDVCNRYANGVIYSVDCATGYVENMVPMYAGGYGVGQLLPSAYSYYNVPMQYRSLYYDTPDHGYWYAPGAIYQYDQGTSMITSVAALMSPGFTIGRPLPLGYDAYNVPYDYRATYYDTPDAWYRYNNGYIYQVDPVTQVVTAIVASLLT